MIVDTISKYIAERYQLIPGISHGEKVSFVAHHIFRTFPGIAEDYIFYCLSSPKIRFYLDIPSTLIYNLPLATTNPRIARFLTPLITNTALGIGIVVQLQEAALSSKELIQASFWSDRLRFLALTYSSLKWAYKYFRLVVAPQKNRTQPIETPRNNDEKISSFTLGVIAITCALQLKYAPKLTLTGFVTGVLIRKFRESLKRNFPQNLSEKNFTTITRWLDKGPIIVSPQSTAQKCCLVWDAWNILALSISYKYISFETAVSEGIFFAKLINW